MADPTTIAKPSERDTDASADPFDLLEAAAETGDEIAFVRAYRSMDWNSESAERHVRAFRLALMAGAHGAARALALKGNERHPDHAELQKIAYIFAPSTARIVPGGPDPSIQADHEWLKAHWGEYFGRWVALRNGELLAMADSPDELLQQVGDVRNRGILITQLF